MADFFSHGATVQVLKLDIANPAVRYLATTSNNLLPGYC
jgi:hypothetical protein